MKVTIAVEGIASRLARQRTARLQDAAIQGALDDLAAARTRSTSTGTADGAASAAANAPASHTNTSSRS